MKFDDLFQHNKEGSIGIRKLKPLMFKCESGQWVNLQYMLSIKVEDTDFGTYKCVVCIYLINRERYILKSGFKSKEQAEEYIDKLLTALSAFN